MSFSLICLQLKLISSLCGLRFGWTNRFTVSGNPISVTFSCHLAQFFCQFFWEKISVRETDNCFEWITKAMTCLDIRFMNFNDYFPENLYTFILQLPPFHTKWDTVNNDIITTALLVHFVPNYIGTFKQSLKCFNSVFLHYNIIPIRRTGSDCLNFPSERFNGTVKFIPFNHVTNWKTNS